MVDLGSITSLANAIGSIIGLASKANTAEANQEIAGIQKSMAEVQRDFADLFQENQNLKGENRKLQEEINAEAMYPFRESVRWKKSVDGTEDDGPFCPTCFGKEKLLMPLRLRHGQAKRGMFSFECPQIHAGGDTVYCIDEISIKKGRYRFPD